MISWRRPNVETCRKTIVEMHLAASRGSSLSSHDLFLLFLKKHTSCRFLLIAEAPNPFTDKTMHG